MPYKKDTKKTRRDNIIKAILGVVAVAGVLSIALVAPNVLQVLPRLGFLRRRKKSSENYYTNKVVKRLIKDNLLVVKTDGVGRRSLSLSAKGEQKLARYMLQETVPIMPKRWDGKWRVVVFDVREYKRSTRDFLRGALKDFGFVYMQQSVWIFPYPCDDFVVLLREALNLGMSVRLLVVEKMDEDRSFRRTFHLPRP